jgi:hypothetical protein
MFRTPKVVGVLALLIGIWFAAVGGAIRADAIQQSPSAPPASTPGAANRAVAEKYCFGCHNQKLKTAGLALDALDFDHVSANAETWEKVIGKLRAGSMPPPGHPRPDAATSHALAIALEQDIDRAWAARPNPGRIAAVHRLNRAEYNNAIRDLLALDIDVKPLLPGDETADGSFDNFAGSLSISATHLNRYLSVAREVTRLAVGIPSTSPVAIFEIPLHVIQDDRQSEDLPLGSRGGIAVRHDFPTDGEYFIKVRLQRQYQDYLKGMGWPQQLDVRLDGRLLKRFTVGGGAKGRPAASSYAGDGEPGFAGDPSWEEYMQLTGDAGLEVRTEIHAGPHVVGVSFVREMWEPEGLPHPLQRARVITNDNVYMDYANVHSVRIGSVSESKVSAKDTPPSSDLYVRAEGRRRGAGLRDKILSSMAGRAYAGPCPITTFRHCSVSSRAGRRDGGTFDAGINSRSNDCSLIPSSSCACIATRPHQSREKPRIAERPEVASRLSFFLWSSIPDDRLIDLAKRGQRLTGHARKKCAGCWLTRAPPTRSSTISPRSG